VVKKSWYTTFKRLVNTTKKIVVTTFTTTKPYCVYSFYATSICIKIQKLKSNSRYKFKFPTKIIYFNFIRLGKLKVEMDPDDDIQSNNNNNGNNGNNTESRIKRINHSEEIDAKYGYVRHRATNEKIGWLINFQSVNI
jgi:hypothetical protein